MKLTFRVSSPLALKPYSLIASRHPSLFEMMIENLKKLAQRILPVGMRRKLDKAACWPPVGMVRFGSLHRLKPISTEWGSERGLPIDRYYIERFLDAHAADVQGHVLEIGMDKYTRAFGGERVTRSDVLHLSDDKPQVTIVGDLTRADHISSNLFDCIILTQTLQFIYDVQAVVKTLYRITKPGGVVLATVPGISQVSRYDMERWGDYWRFSSASIKKLFEISFSTSQISIETFGNVFVAAAFLFGIASDELLLKELDFIDPAYELLIAARAVKSDFIA